MVARVLLAVVLVIGGICVQRWAVQRRQQRRREKQVDIPRWEDEGGMSQAPAPPVSGGGANSEDEGNGR